MKLGSELDVKSFDVSWKEEVSNLVEHFETMPFQDSYFNGTLDHPITLVEISHVVKAIKNKKSSELHVYCIVGELITCGGKPMKSCLYAFT